MTKRNGSFALAIACALLSQVGAASEVIEVRPLTDRIVMLHINDGHVVHHTRGRPRADEKIVAEPLDTQLASQARSYSIASADDPAYRDPRQPIDVGRKSKGTDFGWLCEAWDRKAQRCVNTHPDHTEEHWLYLTLPLPMRRGKTYTVSTSALATNRRTWTIRFDESAVRSEAVHVNLLGYVPSAPRKYAYIFSWMGDRGGLDLKPYEGHACHVVDANTGRSLFDAKIALRKPATNVETFHSGDTPNANFLGADVYDCDFSGFTTPGTYVVAVDGIGSSFPFRVGADVYREPFRTVARGLYHNRSGIELKEPFTKFTRPAPHNPKVTPGFAGKLVYTTIRFTEWGSEGGDAKVLLANAKGPLDAAGWYQDAGDWDSYYTHLRIAQELLFAYEVAPKNFRDGELGIPESGNGAPDILDEAAWLPRFLCRLRRELLGRKYGTGGVGLRITGDAFGGDEKKLRNGTKVGQGSWEDVGRTWVASGEDPWSTYRYAGTAAQLAFCLGLAGMRDPEGVDWVAEARQAYDWAKENTRPGDEAKKEPPLRDPRLYAAAALFRLTGDKRYEQQVVADTSDVTATTVLVDDLRFGPMLYALTGVLATSPAKPEPATYDRIRAAVLHTADETTIATPARRSLRWGGSMWMPMLVGQQTTPMVLEGAVGYVLARSKDPARAERYLAGLYTTADYFLGANSQNMTWVTGLGPRQPKHPLHMDAWYNGRGKPHPGIVVYGPWRKDKDAGVGPWDKDWASKTVYPKVDDWPGNERWFDSAPCPWTNEFTVHQNLAPSAAFFGILASPGLDVQP
jgi:endoglucanase